MASGLPALPWRHRSLRQRDIYPAARRLHGRLCRGDNSTCATRIWRNYSRKPGSPVAAKGTATADVRVSGSLGEPQFDVTLDVVKPEAFGEAMDRVRATLKADAKSLEVSNGQAEDGPARLTFSGAYRLAGSDWSSGSLQVQMTARNLEATRLHAFANLDSGVDARVTTDVRMQGGLAKGAFSLSSIAGTLTAQSVSIHGQPAGEFTVTAATRGPGSLGRGQRQNGYRHFRRTRARGVWTAISPAPPPSAFAHDHRRGAPPGDARAARRRTGRSGPAVGGIRRRRPRDGVLALSHPRDFQASVTLDTVQFNPKAGQALGLGVQPQDIVLKNTEPVVFAMTAKEAGIQSARLTGRDTNHRDDRDDPVRGSGSAGGADLAVRGTVSLAALQLLNPDLLARGNATVEATLRGSLSESVAQRPHGSEGRLAISEGCDHRYR